MDAIKIEKARAMERYKKIRFLQILFQYLLTALILAMAISKVLPSSLFSSIKLFFSVYLPNLGAFIISPKCVFIVCNAIVIFLFSESKLAGTSTSSRGIYDEYLRHQQNLRRQSSVEEKEKEKRLNRACSGEGEEDKMIKEGDDEVVKGELEEEKREEEKEEEHKQQEEEEDEKEKGDEQLEEEEKAAAAAEEEEDDDDDEEEKEEAGMAADELNRRADDFIAKITKQFRLEAQMLACGG